MAIINSSPSLISILYYLITTSFLPFFLLPPLLVVIAYFLLGENSKPWPSVGNFLSFLLLYSLSSAPAYSAYPWQLIFFISTLCISLITDLYFFLISRYVTLYLIPFVWIAAYFQIIPISLYESIEGALISFLFLWSFKHLFLLLRKYDGLGQGDIDMLAYIGAFTGILGAWCTLLYACIVSLSYLPLQHFFLKESSSHIPLGVFLCIGCWLYLLFPNFYISLINLN